MGLVPLKSLLQHAKAHHYGVPSFNVFNLESIQALIQVCTEEDAPAIIANGTGVWKSGNLADLGAASCLLASRASVPLAVNLDHGPSFEFAMQAIRLGFTGVMIDASTRPWEENVAITKKVAEAAHAAGVTCEGEIGHVGQGSEELTDDLRAKLLTTPEMAVRFVTETGVDSVAIAIGNLHGVYKFPPKLEFERLEAIAQVCPAYLVMHGGSQTPGLDRAVQIGIQKVNVGTDISLAFRDGVKASLAADPSASTASLLAAGLKGSKEMMRSYIRLFGANGQASKMRAELVV